MWHTVCLCLKYVKLCVYEIMIELKDFTKLGLRITWTLIDIGFRGSDIFFNQLKTSDIIEFAKSTLYSDNYYEEAAELAGEGEANIYEIDKYVKILSSYEKCERSFEFEKWVVCYVNKHIQNKCDNCIDGLTELADIWIKLEIPNDCPFVFQGLNNKLTPEKYYTMKNYDKLYQNHINWIEDKLKKLKEKESLC